jgi:hypothetical protein
MAAAIMHRDSANHLGKGMGTAPGANNLLVAALVHGFNF